MKNITPAILVAFLSFGIVTGFVYAQDEEPLPDAGLSPSSPFYFLDILGERISLAFTRGKVAKAQKQTRFAEERLAEAQKMADEEKDEEAEEAAERYGQLISDAAANLASAAAAGEDITESLTKLVTRATSIHLTVLSEVYEKVPEQAKSAIERAMQAGARGQEEALGAVSGEARAAVEERLSEVRAEVESRLEGLRQQGIPVPAVFGDGERGRIPASQPVPQRVQPATPAPVQSGPPAGVGVPGMSNTEEQEVEQERDAGPPAGTPGGPPGGAGPGY